MLRQLKHTAAAAAFSAAMFAAGAANAVPFTFNSGDSVNESNTLTGTNVVITPHSVWGNVGGGAQWISHANTGIGGFFMSNVSGRNRADATAVFTETLGYIDAFSLRVLADDTATVDLVNLTTSAVTNLFTAFAGQIDPCAPGGTGVAVGCIGNDMGIIANTALVPGNYILRVYAFQTNSDVYGIQYTGTGNAAVYDAPEPLSAGLVLAGLVGMAAVRRRSHKDAATV